MASGPAQPPFYVPRFDPSYWSGAPKGINPILLLETPTAGSRTLQLAPFWAPRPPMPFDWRWQPPRNPSLLTPQAQSPFVNEWSAYNYVPPADWLGTPLPADAIYLPQAAPFSTQWRYDYTSPPDWLGSSIGAPFEVLGGKVPTKQWHHDYVPDPPWTWKPPPSYPLFALVEGGEPFAKFWRYDYVPDPVWTGEPQPTNIGTFPSAQAPFSRLWRWDYQPEPVWTWEAPSVSYVMLGGQVPTKQWRWDYQPDAFWLGTPVGAPFEILGGQVRAKQWRYDHVPDPPWIWEPPSSYPLFALVVGGEPFSHQWRWDYVPDPVWQGAPVPTNIETIPSGAPFFKQWRYDYDSGASFWQGTPLRVSYTMLGGRPFARQWHYDLVPDPVWTWEPPPAYPLFALVVGGNPFHKQWRWDHVPDPIWLGEPQSININTFSVAAPFSNEWSAQYRYVPDAIWVGEPQPTNIETFPTGNPIGVEWYAQYTYVPPPDWSWKAPPTDTLRLLTEAKPFAKQWRYDLVPTPDWSWKPPPTDTLRLLTQARPNKRLWRWDHVPDQFWQGKPLAWNAEIRPATVAAPFVPPSYAHGAYVPQLGWQWYGRTGLTIDLVFLLRRVPTDAVLGMLGYFCFGQELVAPHLHHDITDTTIIQKTTDAILMGQQDYEFTEKTWDVRPMDVKVKVTIATDGVKNISGTEPTFTTKTGNKGYD